MTVAAYTLGCKVNACDTEETLARFSAKGYEIVDFQSLADIYIINTCSVTSLSDKKSRQILRRARLMNPRALVVAAGCFAQASPEEAGRVPGINLVAGVDQRENIVSMVEERIKKLDPSFQSVPDTNPAPRRFSGRTRAYLKIQDGCDFYCNYCIVPYLRGPVRSKAIGEAFAEAESLAGDGAKEIVLSGINISSYGKDLEHTDILKLLSKIHTLPGIRRIRFSSLEPGLITKDFTKQLIQFPKVCDHFHLSLQSGSDYILRAMNRKYTCREYESSVFLLREQYPDAGLTTDIITGFPGESPDHFDESLSFIKKIGFSRIHVFPYSPRKGAPAASFDNQVSGNEKKYRSGLARELGNEMEKAFIDKRKGRIMAVLFERRIKKDVYEGHTTNYIKVRASSGENIINQIKEAEI